MVDVVTLNKSVWEGLFARLDGAINVGGVVPVRETQDPAQAMPFINLAVEFDAPSAQRVGDGAAQISVFAQTAEAVLAIQAAIVARINRYRVNVTGGTALLLPASTPAMGRGEDGTTRHGVQIFRVLIHS